MQNQVIQSGWHIWFFRSNLSTIKPIFLKFSIIYIITIYFPNLCTNFCIDFNFFFFLQNTHFLILRRYTMHIHYSNELYFMCEQLFIFILRCFYCCCFCCSDVKCCVNNDVFFKNVYVGNDVFFFHLFSFPFGDFSVKLARLYFISVVDD